jgi:hypothetical protein
MTYRTGYALSKEYEALRAREERKHSQVAIRQQQGAPVPEKVEVLASELSADARRREDETRARLCAARQERVKEAVLQQYDRLGLERPPPRADGLVTSPALLMSLGARIEEISGRRTLTLPSRGIPQEFERETQIREMGR